MIVADVQALGAGGQLSLYNFAGSTHVVIDVTARNRGGEDHTFTEVANFGGGCIAALNDLLGLRDCPASTPIHFADQSDPAANMARQKAIVRLLEEEQAAEHHDDAQRADGRQATGFRPYP